ncbi:Protein of unknown function [Paracoccus aminovorans]|uniref:DUF3325 domain-containing protein n=1 Tax=Paracoccus aminovorans TaxID=34004 RepID=A0A1I3APT4_9RHOB|nr:DUF3325 domain-containing protein [Paracoccus aminovorans]CQR84314.1 hypothetical protein JCM7685_pAMV3p0369 [Paracoccus aminovorans]SFH52077.1 Protein of unknown function [Paracoccus aminovorans]
MTHGLVLTILLAGFACLALSMDRHQRDEFGRPLPAGPTRALRWFGWLLIPLALPVAIHGLGTGFGLVAWTGHLSLASALVFAALLCRNRRRAARR